MTFVIGFLIWAALGIGAGFLVGVVYRGPTTTTLLSIFCGVGGAVIGGMLGVSAYVTHDPSPVRFGAMLGAVVGALFFPWVYHLVARKAL